MPSINVSNVTGLSATGTTPAVWNPNGYRSSVQIVTNPAFIQQLVLDPNYVVLMHAGVTPVAIAVADLVAMIVGLVPAMTWAPVISVQPVNQSFIPTVFGPSGHFSIQTVSQLAVSYQWQYSQNQGLSWLNCSNGVFFTGVTTAALSVGNVQPLVNALFRCVATNANGSTTSNTAVYTATDPGIVIQPSPATVVHGSQAQFSITAGSFSLLSYNWQELTPTGGWSNIANGGLYSGQGTATLTLNPTTVGMSGNEYRVIVTNSATNQSVTSSAVALTVN